MILIDADSSRLAAAELLRSLAGEAPMGEGSSADLPPIIDGLRVRYLTMHRFRVTGSKYVPQGTPSSCSLRRQLAPEGSGR